MRRQSPSVFNMDSTVFFVIFKNFQKYFLDTSLLGDAVITFLYFTNIITR